MRNNKRRLLALLGLLVVLVFALGTTGLAAGDPTEEPGSKMIVCADCGGEGICMTCYGQDPACEDCGGTGVCASCEGTGYVESTSPFYNTAWALLPPVIAIALALITKEVYSSLFIGILVGGLLYSNFSFEGTLTHVFEDGIVGSLADSYNVGILIFLVILGAMVCLMNRAGGSAAFGRWAQSHIKSRVGAQLITVLLGVLIFIDDYFNCLTVGSVMRPVTDKYKVSRAKLAYIIDSTAAPICIIAPISSWAAAVAGFAEDGQGLNLFIKAIPFNFYALLTILMLVFISILKLDYGPMARHERNAMETGDLFSGKNPYGSMEEEESSPNGRVLDLVFPILVLIVCCITGMIYSGGFFDGVGFVEAFSNSDASVGLMLGSAVAFIITLVSSPPPLHALQRHDELHPGGLQGHGARHLDPHLCLVPEGHDRLSGIHRVCSGASCIDTPRTLPFFLPAIVFIIGCLLAFATGTSWGTFGMLIPIVQNVFPMDNPLAVVCISACMAGAVCGDHCSPISDTTIMASAGAQCDHVNHVSTQLPYAITVAAVSFVSYLIAGFVPKAYISLPIALVLMLLTIFVLHRTLKGKAAA